MAAQRVAGFQAYPQRRRVAGGARGAGQGAGRRTLGQQLGQLAAEHALHGGRADVVARQAQQLQAGGGGADDPAVFAERHQALGDGAQALGLRVQPHHDAGAMPRAEELVLHHARAAAHQGQRVAVVAAAVAGDVQHAQQLAAGVGDGGGGAGQKAVALQVVLAGMHDQRLAFGQRRAYGVGAAPLLAPERAGAQRDAGGAVGELQIALGVQQQALRIGQQHEVVAALHLLVQKGHHRPGVRHQRVAVLQRPCELGGAGMGRALGPALGLEAQCAAAGPAGLQRRGEQALGHGALVQPLAAGQAQAVGRCGGLGCGHGRLLVRPVCRLWRRA